MENVISDEEEEALKWAAIERLPTYARLKKAILIGVDDHNNISNNTNNIVDVHNLSLEEKKNLVERLVKVPDQDNHIFLTKLRNRIDTVGIQLPTIEVRFQHVNVETEAYVGTRALPSFINFPINIIEVKRYDFMFKSYIYIYIFKEA